MCRMDIVRTMDNGVTGVAKVLPVRPLDPALSHFSDIYYVPFGASVGNTKTNSQVWYLIYQMQDMWRI